MSPFFMKSIIFISLFFLYGCLFFPSGKVSKYESHFPQNEYLGQGKIKVTYFGTSTLLFEDENDQVIIDGFFTRSSVGKVAFGKVSCDTLLVKEIVQKYSINKLKAIFVCHSHYDHSMDAPYLAKLTGATIYGSHSTLNVARGYGINENQLKEFSPNDMYSFGNFKVKVLESLHTPPFRFLGFTNDNHKEPNIEKPLKQPAKFQAFKEGGTFDFYFENQKIKWMVKASTNFIPNLLKNYSLDYYFLATATLGKMKPEFQEKYYQETVLSTRPSFVIPIHWDNFMKPLNKPFIPLSRLADNFNRGMNFLIEKSLKDSFKVVIIPHVSTIYLKEP